MKQCARLEIIFSGWRGFCRGVFSISQTVPATTAGTNRALRLVLKLVGTSDPMHLIGFGMGRATLEQGL